MGATNADKQLAQDLITDWISEEAARSSGGSFALDAERIADGYGLDETAVETVCQKLAARPNTPLKKQDGGWVVVP
ncbi:hypothetical protein BRD20_10180 [Halobacteriales archaeon SW_8_65_20]|nr:MAG: hypothetical protein BRD20_10180 [Halobacteriales archaeon SW_8_65_20]